jgi:hypothetical protein
MRTIGWPAAPLGRMGGRRAARTAVAIVGVMAALSVVSLTSGASTLSTTAITVDGTRAGPAFQGVGAISGGGGNSRLLIDYPEPQRSQILDYLFKPNYGATVELLKLEIGGDANSTDGAEPSVEHAQGRIDCGSGYEWWIAEQARARNPNIKLYGLQWAAPGWVGSGTLWTRSDVDYVIDWLNYAGSHGLMINYLGGWNEIGYHLQWYENLRAALDANGYGGVKIVAADDDPNTSSGYDPARAWAVADVMATDPTFNSSIAVLGAHDTCDYPTTGYVCKATSTARSLGKPLWESELGAMNSNTGAPAMARSINNGYNQAGITGVLHWPLLDATAPGLPHRTQGLVYAEEPWSGHYQVNEMTWAIAHTTQFVGQGWTHVGSANKPLAGTNMGSYDTYRKPGSSIWTMVVQTSIAKASQQVDVTVTGGLSTGPVHVWATNLDSADSADWFRRLRDLTPSNGSFSYTLRPGYLYTFTTNSGQSKGAAPAPPASAPLPRRFQSTLGVDDGSHEPALVSPQDGAFEIAACRGGLPGDCLQQMTPQRPVYWRSHPGFPYAVLGDAAWSDYTVSLKALFTTSGASAGVIGRFSNRGSAVSNFRGYILDVTDAGAWQLLKNSKSVGVAVLAQGTVAPLGTNTWHDLSIKLAGTSIGVAIDGDTVGSVTDDDPNYSAGSAGIEAGAQLANGAFSGASWPVVQYRDLSVTP